MTLALLLLTAAALAYPWHTPTDRWVLGAAVVVVTVVFAWWRGLFVTDMVGRRIAIWRRNRNGGGHALRPTEPVDRITALLRIDTAAPEHLPVIAGYVDRYGVRADKVRLASRDAAGQRTTWIGLTMDASENLAALQARSPRLPLRETAEVAARRLADHLRELGAQATVVSDTDTPVPPSAQETWRGLRTDAGYVAAYRVTVDDALPDTLAAVRSQPSAETWTVIDITGTPGKPELTVGCALVTEQRPGTGAPVAGLTPTRGRHRPALAAMAPLSTDRVDGQPVAAPAGLLARLADGLSGREHYSHGRS
jgi:type VII secretion protein EccE